MGGGRSTNCQTVMRLHHATRPTCSERTDFLSPSFTCLTYTSSFARYRQYLLGRSFKSASMVHSTTCLLPPCYRNKRSYEHPCRSWCIRLLGCPANSSSWVGIDWGGSELLISGPSHSIHNVEAFASCVTPRSSELLAAPHVIRIMFPVPCLTTYRSGRSPCGPGSMSDPARPPQSLPRDWAARPDIFAGACWKVATPCWRSAGLFPTPLGSVHRPRPRV